MVKFERRDPFPLVDLDAFSKSEAASHARDADSWLGLRVEEIERALAGGKSNRPAPLASGQHQQLWFGLEPRDLQTPYLEIRHLLQSVVPMGRPSIVVDLGAAYARMAFVIERHFLTTRFIGFEYVGERVEAARQALSRIGAKRSSVEHVDLTCSLFELPTADVYFIYDYGTPTAIEKTLHDLRKISLRRDIVIIARGRVCRYAIESRHGFWLKRANPGEPERSVTVYRSSLAVDRVEAPVQDTVKIIDSTHHTQYDGQI